MSEVEELTPEPITLTVLRCGLRETLDRVVYFDERFVVTRNGDPVAVIVGVEAYRRLVGMGKEEDRQSQR